MQFWKSKEEKQKTQEKEDKEELEKAMKEYNPIAESRLQKRLGPNVVENLRIEFGSSLSKAMIISVHEKAKLERKHRCRTCHKHLAGSFVLILCFVHGSRSAFFAKLMVSTNWFMVCVDRIACHDHIKTCQQKFDSEVEEIAKSIRFLPIEPEKDKTDS